MKVTTKINKLLLNIPWLILISLFVFMIYYNYSLQQQIYERDKIIQHLAFSDSLVNKYFDIKVDTLEHSTMYTLKDEYSPKEIHHHETTTIEKTFTYVIEDTTKIMSQQNQIEDIAERYNNLVCEYNELGRKYNNFNSEFVEVNDSLNMYKLAMSLINRNFDINFKGSKDSNQIRVTITCEKADSAFRLLPYFRNKLKFNETKNLWEIKK